MSQLNEIISGWKNYIFPNKQVEELAIERMEICLGCDKLKDNKRCGVCGCFMPAKVRSVKSTCPLKKW
jgi:hypothetical protein